MEWELLQADALWNYIYCPEVPAAAAQAISTDIPATISPHVFRHTKAMHLVQANVNTIYIKEILGHADISTTEVYARARQRSKTCGTGKSLYVWNYLALPNWEQDADLIAWLFIPWLKETYYAQWSKAKKP